MAFTGRSLINTAAIYNDEPIDVSLAVPAINRALGILGDMGLVFQDVSIVAAEQDTYYPTIDNATAIIRVSNDKKKTYILWQADDAREIQFRDAGTYTVRVRRLSAQISGIDTSIDIHPAFEQVICSFLIGFAKLEDDDTNPDGQKNLEQTFRNDAVKVASELIAGVKHRSTAFKVVRRRKCAYY
jgi:hypothetical protein